MTELNYYKNLSTAIDKRIRDLESAIEKTRESKNLVELSGSTQNVSSDLISGLETENESKNLNSDSANLLIDYSIEDANITCLEKCTTSSSTEKQVAEKVSDFLDSKFDTDKSISCENKSCTEEALLGNSISSMNGSTDLNQYLNTSASLATDTTETTPENYKPQVPKTLDIIPITLETRQKTDTENSTCDESKPKLVRRGSYVLETPSPMLLAHMQTNLTSPEYTPTSTDSSKKRKECLE